MEVGNFLLFASLLSALTSTILFFHSAKSKNPKSAEIAEVLIYFSLSTCFASILILIYYFITDNFAIKYVYEHSHKTMNVLYKLCAIWSGKEGSLVFWCFLNILFTSLFIAYGRKTFEWLKASAILTGISSYVLLISLLDNPFQTLPFKPFDGLGLNPILRTFEVLVHPPLIFLAYTLSTILFAMQISGLNGERIARVLFLLLSLGIISGGFWAYKTLGWGGFWGWDPVENVSLLPWLSVLAYLHSKKARVFFSYLTFVSVIFAAFVTRGGIVESLHAFTGSGGEFFLILIVLATLVAYRHIKLDFKEFCYTSQIFLAMMIVLTIGILASMYYNVSIKYYYVTFLPLFALSLILILKNLNKKIFLKKSVLLIHIGVLLLFIGSISVWGFEKKYHLTLAPSTNFSNFEFNLKSIEIYEDLEKTTAKVKIESNLGTFEPEVYIYKRPEKMVSSVSIVSTPLFDYYLVVHKLSSEFVRVEFSVIPLISLVWLASVFITLGTILRIFTEIKNKQK